MVYNLKYSDSILESLMVLSNFSVTETIWNAYMRIAMPKLKEVTVLLRGSLYYLKELNLGEAEAELKSINLIIPVIIKVKSQLETIEDAEFLEFKTVAMDFIEAIDMLKTNLEEIADTDQSYKMSIPVLADDWDRPENDHWNEY